MDQVTSNYMRDQFGKMKQEYQGLAQKLAELDVDKREHILVLGTMEKLPAERRAYRMVGGVLVERTVGEVLPAVKANLDGIKQVMSNLEQGMRKKQQEMQEFQEKARQAGAQLQ